MQSLRGKKRTPCEGAGQLPALLLDQRARYLPSTQKPEEENRVCT
jgi:hypothetical protein